MSNYKSMFQMLFSSSCKRSQEQMLSKLESYAKLKGGVWSKSCVRYFNDKLTAIKRIGLQCNVIAAHRVRRSGQILNLYRSLYGKESPGQFFKKLGELIRKNPEGKIFLLLGAAFFDWKDNSISDRDLNRVTDELTAFFDLKANYNDTQGESWEQVHDEDHFKLWRCPVQGSSLYKYKVFGSYKDIPARAFFNIQLDLEYRKTWDNHVIRLEKVEEDSETGSEVIYWATKFPLGFLYNRDYVYVRRYKIDVAHKYMMLTAKSVEHPSFPATKDFIRVGDYTSNMVIRPHTSFDENGLDYVMSYYDDPQLYVPTWAINRMTLKHLPEFLEELHEAAAQLVHSSCYVSSVTPRDINSTPRDINSTPRDINSNSMQSRIIEVGQRYGYVDPGKH